MQVVTAKVMAKAQSKNERFGYVSMATPEAARKSIAGLNGTEVKGRTVTVEVVSTCNHQFRIFVSVDPNSLSVCV